MTDIVDSPPPGRKVKAGRDPAIGRHWVMLSEHHTRVANAADALREALSSIFDTSLALADVRLNQIVKKLSAWAAIIAVPTLVTGFVGMNVGFRWRGAVPGSGCICCSWSLRVWCSISSSALRIGSNRARATRGGCRVTSQESLWRMRPGASVFLYVVES